ncbi:hypothetical protein [Fibrella forsythiae]|uniref:RES domain-containing protein n=1 Tax=Fibrella forsythiae TaxID=2817061 RepID=A0ABS3JTY6_9BACT|nr:hypothetical protein [Fibrella forsythiae]MBO0952664.1 hypothetical protein [Fibrella forsythiae]
MSSIISDLSDLKRLHSRVMSYPIDREKIFKKIREFLVAIKYNKGAFYYRVPMLFRAVSNEREEWFDNISKLGIAPKCKAQMSRCNWRGEPMFYGSSDNGVPIFEIRAKEGDFVVLSSFVNNDNPYNTNEIPIVFNGVVLGVKKILENLKESDVDFKNLLYQDDTFKENTPKVIKELDDYMGELFTEVVSNNNKNLYLITSSICRNFMAYLKNDRVVEGFIYPSVESNRTGFNVALGEAYTKNHLKLYSASMYKVTSYDVETKAYTLQPVKSLCSDEEGGRAKWKRIAARHEGENWVLSPNTPSTRDIEIPVLSLEGECE